MTATALHAALIAAGCPPRIEGPDVVFDSRPPAALARYLPVLLTGVRAVATGRRWFGNDRDTGRPCGPHPANGDGPLAFGALDPAATLPRNVGLLSVEGADGLIDRLPREWLSEFSEVFDPEPTSRLVTVPVTLKKHSHEIPLWPA